MDHCRLWKAMVFKDIPGVSRVAGRWLFFGALALHTGGGLSQEQPQRLDSEEAAEPPENRVHPAGKG